ncbi:hypothetical protein SAMN02745163_03575 [Clostridium cavendishii DSM 21758]|uniref:Polymerase/histidinol phosphatase N-terminal domain-containing protein n=1 Tax=Clostridium cavendishii DSM 21758 TaxID=1121302 RepID=A0A1M6R8Y0_9CLOT|nr:PHP domain-containing protein [Clostridium cavendishii]SHK28939.1 hypothetical protein SAMN02745163_03575 [Clostridium cavendishii DSM 21758]
MTKVDLHIHSKYSDDGEFSPEEIVCMAIEAGVNKIAIADHNSVKGVKEAVEYSKNRDIDVISGIEIDCTYEGVNLHILGYDIDYNEVCFLKLEEDIINQEINASEEKIKKIEEYLKVKINRESIKELAPNGIVTGELIGEILLSDESIYNNEYLKPYRSGGERSDMPFVNFYWDYFSQGKPAYVEIKYPSLKDTIAMIKNSNGYAVIAHPGNNLKNKLDLLDRIIDEGIDGIEVYSSYHNKEQKEYFSKKALENNLIITYGSDFHGKNKPNIRIGEI